MPAEGGDEGEPVVSPQLAADTEKLLELYQEQIREFNEFEAARESLRSNAVKAIEAVPGLKLRHRAWPAAWKPMWIPG